MANSPVEAFDSGSNYKFGDKMERAKLPRSPFDLTHLITTTIENCGQVQVLDIIETLPGDDHEISIKSLIRCLPQVVPLYSRQRVYIYAFWSRYSDLWANFGTFITKGYNGNTIKEIPTYNDNNLVQEIGAKVIPGCLADGIGIQQGLNVDQLKGLNCLDAMQLLRIFRDYFMNKNYFIEDKVMLPDDDSRFRLNDNGQLLSALDENVTFKFDLCSGNFDGYIIHYENDVESYRSFTQFCHDWPQDYFTSALPWPQRGSQAELSLDITNTSLNLPLSQLEENGTSVGKFIKSTFTTDETNPKTYRNLTFIGSSGNAFQLNPALNTFVNINPNNQTASSFSLNNSYNQLSGTYDERDIGVHIPSDFLSGSVAITLQSIREMVVEQTELEKMARTDGSFAEFGLTFFNEKSKNAIDFKPVYIGGIYDNIQYSEVLQTNIQYAEDSGEYKPVGSPLGTYGGHGIGSNNGYIGRLHCDDYGQIMIMCCIMPDVYYSTGIERRLTNKYQSDMFLPERAKLGLRPILNKELFVSGNSSVDDNLFAYQNIFDEYRYLPNRIKGKIADSNSENFYPYTQSRKITSTPNYSHEFAEAKDVRKDYLASYEEVAFTAQFKIADRCVRALPYKGIPADILN